MKTFSLSAKLSGFLMLVLFFGQKAFAQNEVLLPFMEDVAQSTYRNPVARPNHNLSIGLPVLSGLSGAYRNSAFSLKDIVFTRNDSTILNPDLMLAKMQRGSNYIYFGTNIDWAHVGWKSGSTWYSVSLTDRFETHLSIPGDLATLAWKGNLGFARRGETADFSSLNLRSNHWRELGLLMQWELGKDKEWLLGVRPKYIMGLSHAGTGRNNLSLQTDTSNPYVINARTEFELRTSTGPVDPSQNNSNLSPSVAVMNYLFNFSNPGFGADLGLRYRAKDSKWDFSVNLTDLGFVYWTSNTRTYKGSSNPVQYKGVTFRGFVYNDQFVGVNALGDSLRKTVGYTETKENFISTLTAQGQLQTQYHAADWVTLGAGVNAWEFEGLRTAVNINALLKWNRYMGLALGYTIQNGRFDNLGVGVYVKPGPFQLYFVSDNLPGLLAPASTYNTNYRVGLNLVFKGKEDRDKDGVIDSKDNCPDVPGSAATDGCPDQDHDGIADNLDECPTEPGLKELMGCPDKDKDGIADTKDQCPTEPGLAELQGCPDRDKDGIRDKDDKCPDVAGIAALQGCPDRDKDGITDLEDACPDSAGYAYLKGCPDTDLDSIPNQLDKCPTVKGPRSNNGCPLPEKKPEPKPEPVVAPEPVQEPVDTDGDGVLDPMDECPKTPGPASNKGCPVLEQKQKEVIKRAFSNLEFDFNKATIRPKSYPAMKELAALLKETPSLRLNLAGHTDNKGNKKANMELSRNRTQAVQALLIKQGASPNQIVAKWFGDTKPIASNKTPQGREKNRRVEMKLLYE